MLSVMRPAGGLEQRPDWVSHSTSTASRLNSRAIDLCFVRDIAALALSVDLHLADPSYRRASCSSPQYVALAMSHFECTYLALRYDALEQKRSRGECSGTTF
jgi:hypothetical protein